MMKKVFLALTVVSFLASCSTSNDVVSNGLFQKRKYKKGWHINKKANVKDNKKAASLEDVAYTKKSVLYAKQEVEQPLVAPKKEEVLVSQKVTELKPVISSVNEPVATQASSAKKANVSKAKATLTETQEELNIEFNESLTVAQKEVKRASVQKTTGDTSSNGHPMILLYILAIFIPPVAVGLVTDWEATPVISNLLWCLLCGIPGIIHAFIIIDRYR